MENAKKDPLAPPFLTCLLGVMREASSKAFYLAGWWDSEWGKIPQGLKDRDESKGFQTSWLQMMVKLWFLVCISIFK